MRENGVKNYGTCEYHPDRIAVAMCKRCKVTVCSECVKVYKYQTDPVNWKKENLCPDCKNYKTRNDSIFKTLVYLAILAGFIYILVFYGGNSG